MFRIGRRLVLVAYNGGRAKVTIACGIRRLKRDTQFSFIARPVHTTFTFRLVYTGSCFAQFYTADAFVYITLYASRFVSLVRFPGLEYDHHNFLVPVSSEGIRMP